MHASPQPADPHAALRGALRRAQLEAKALAEDLAKYASQVGGAKCRARSARQKAVTAWLRGLQDALGHQTALIGYFDGFAARSAHREAQEATLTWPTLGAPMAQQLSEASSVARALERGLLELSQRPDLSMAPKGPTKPGPARTTALATSHLRALRLHLAGLLVAQKVGASDAEARYQSLRLAAS